MSIDDLVIDLAGNKMADANNKFLDIMSTRVNDALDAKKIELAKSLGVQEEEPEITDVEDEDENEEEIVAADQEDDDEEYEDDLDDGADEFETEVEAEVAEDEDVQGDQNTPQ